MNLDFTISNYFKMKEKYEKGEISSEEWTLYCMTYLYDLMIMHQNILKKIEND